MSEITVHCCDPQERASEIKALFTRCGQPEFEPYFDRVYPQRASEGLRSWIGTTNGSVVAHISVTPLAFGDGERVLLGGILGDLQVVEEHRDFWTPVRLVRTMVAEVKREGRIDFLLTTTTADAEAIFKGAGFKVFGQLRRFVLPLMAPYVLFSRLRAGVRSRVPDTFPLMDCRVGELLPKAGSNGAWRPLASSGFYATRIPKDAFIDGTWVSGGGGGGGCSARRLALVGRHASRPEGGVSDAFWDDGGRGFGEMAFAAARWGRAERFDRLSISTLDGTDAARELMRCGFFPRSIRSALLLHTLRGAEVPPLERWFLPGLAMSGW